MKLLSLRGALWRAAELTYGFWERAGIHVSPVHFYWPLPDTGELDPALWASPSELIGVEMREQAQLKLLDDVSSAYRDDYDRFPRHESSDPTTYFVDNDSFVSTDAEMLYSMVRRLRPRKIIEVGSGFSTLLMSQALTDAGRTGSECDFVVCDPFPGDRVRGGLPAVTRLVPQPVQRVPLREFESLGANDILFIDSSHVLKIGSDVQYLFLEVLPRLAEGVVVHIHDIFLPDEYPRDWIVHEHRFWTEQYLLQAFLTFNSAWEVMWAGSYMHSRHSEALSTAFSSHSEATRPGSFWMRRIASRRSEGSAG